MASANHHHITKILNKIVKSYSCLRTIKKINILDITHKSIDYDPDYVIKRILSENTYYFVIFEVIEGQSDTKTMADIARILAKPEIKKAIFICSKNKVAETKRIADALIGAYKDRFEKRNKKQVINISIRELLPTDKEVELENIILEELKPFLPKNSTSYSS